MTKKGVYSTKEEVKFRSIKRPKVIVKYEATKEHPAQTELLYLDFQVGKYVTTKVRTKANNVDVNNVKIGQKLFDFINQSVL